MQQSTRNQLTSAIFLLSLGGLPMGSRPLAPPDREGTARRSRGKGPPNPYQPMSQAEIDSHNAQVDAKKREAKARSAAVLVDDSSMEQPGDVKRQLPAPGSDATTADGRFVSGAGYGGERM